MRLCRADQFSAPYRLKFFWNLTLAPKNCLRLIFAAFRRCLASARPSSSCRISDA